MPRPVHSMPPPSRSYLPAEREQRRYQSDIETLEHRTPGDDDGCRDDPEQRQVVGFRRRRSLTLRR